MPGEFPRATFEDWKRRLNADDPDPWVLRDEWFHEAPGPRLPLRERPARSPATGADLAGGTCLVETCW